jgi:hypothetical protein
MRDKVKVLMLMLLHSLNLCILQSAVKSTAAAAAPQQQSAAKATPSKSLFGSKPSAAAAKPAAKSSSSSSSSSSSGGITFSPKLQAELTAKLGSARAVDALQKRAEAYSKGVSTLLTQHILSVVVCNSSKILAVDDVLVLAHSNVLAVVQVLHEHLLQAVLLLLLLILGHRLHV